MPTKISALPAGTAAGADEIPANQSGTTRKLTAQDIADLRAIVAADVTPLAGVGSRVKGLIGGNNSGTPATQFDLSADEVVLVNPSDETSVVQFATGVITNNVSTAGSTANGRDQAGAFSSSSWIHFWFIWNGTTLATLSSASATAPTLPSGYTHRAYAGAVRYTAAPVLRPTRFIGSAGYQDETMFGASGNVLAAGTSASFVAVDCSGWIPPNSREGFFAFGLHIPGGGTAIGIYATVRPTGSAENGQIAGVFGQAQSFYQEAINLSTYPVDSAQSIDYLLFQFSGSGAEVFIDVLGYKMPNGGE